VTRLGVIAVAVALVLGTAQRASAQAPLRATPGPMPAGHPPITAKPAASAQAPVPATAAPLPAGHPPIGARPAASAPGTAPPPPPAPMQASPHGTMPPHGTMGGAPHGSMPQPNREEPASDLPAGTVEVLLVDADEQPIPNADVRLGILFQSVAEGESRSQRTAKTDSKGIVRFDKLTTGSAYGYRATSRTGPAEYASSPFNLRDTGMRVTLHVFPVTSNAQEAVVGMRGFFYIETRDDVFQIETLFRVMNLGRTAWVPSDVVMTLPEGFKAFNAGDGMKDTRFEAVEGRGARLLGTYPPGSHDVSFRFQVPKPADETVSFNVRPLPRTAEMRVLAVSSKTMTLQVDGFETPQKATGPNGDPVLVTRKVVGRGEPEVGSFTVVLSGLPVPSVGRWYVVVIALAFGIAGAMATAGKLKFVSTERLVSDRARARELLFVELVALSRAQKNGEVGPNAFDRAYRLLVDALARIGLPTEKKRRKAARAAESSPSTPSG